MTTLRFVVLITVPEQTQGLWFGSLQAPSLGSQKITFPWTRAGSLLKPPFQR